ncbi:MAG: hypothetical protein Q9217_005448 [Psora testacea]
MSDELKTSFLGALQASLSVLLVLSYGVIAAQFDILKGPTTKQISTLCVRVFLPALLVTNVGSQLHVDTGIRYVPILRNYSAARKSVFTNCILVWGLFYALTSMLLGYILTRVFKLPSWTTPAVCFNNTTALPLLLIQSLSATGVLDQLLISKSDTSSDALLRAKSYFLVNAMIGDSLTFAMGPKLLDGEEAPEKEQAREHAKPDDEQTDHREHSNSNARDVQPASDSDGPVPNEQTSLLPSFLVRAEEAAGHFSTYKERKGLSHLPTRVQSFLHFSYAFFHAPLIGAATGAIIGLAPPLHEAFFGSP